MKPELKIKTAPKYRAEQYVTIRRPFHIEQRRPVSLAGIQVRQAVNTGLAMAQKASSARAIYPNPLLYEMVIATGIEAFLHEDDTAAKIEAFAMRGICEEASDPTPTRANYSSVKPSNITFSPSPTEVIHAMPPGFAVSKIGLAFGLTGAGLLLATMGGGALCYFLYLHNKKDGTVRVQEIKANKVGIMMDKLKVPDEVRVKYEQVAIEQLPLIQAGEIT